MTIPTEGPFRHDGSHMFFVLLTVQQKVPYITKFLGECPPTPPPPPNNPQLMPLYSYYLVHNGMVIVYLTQYISILI